MANTVPENDQESTPPETRPNLEDSTSYFYKLPHEVALGNLPVADKVPEDDQERARRETNPYLTGSISSCDENTPVIRLESLSLPIPVFFVDDKYLSDRSFDILAKLVSRIQLEDFNTIERAVSCLNGLEKYYLGFVPSDASNSRFHLDGYLHFESSSGKLKIMYFRLVEFINFDELFIQIEDMPDFEGKVKDLGILRDYVIEKVYTSSLQN